MMSHYLNLLNHYLIWLWCCENCRGNGFRSFHQSCYNFNHLSAHVFQSYTEIITEMSAALTKKWRGRNIGNFFYFRGEFAQTGILYIEILCRYSRPMRTKREHLRFEIWSVRMKNENHQQTVDSRKENNEARSEKVLVCWVRLKNDACGTLLFVELSENWY